MHTRRLTPPVTSDFHTIAHIAIPYFPFNTHSHAADCLRDTNKAHKHNTYIGTQRDGPHYSTTRRRSTAFFGVQRPSRSLSHTHTHTHSTQQSDKTIMHMPVRCTRARARACIVIHLLRSPIPEQVFIVSVSFVLCFRFHQIRRSLHRPAIVSYQSAVCACNSTKYIVGPAAIYCVYLFILSPFRVCSAARALVYTASS